MGSGNVFNTEGIIFLQRDEFNKECGRRKIITVLNIQNRCFSTFENTSVGPLDISHVSTYATTIYNNYFHQSTGSGDFWGQNEVPGV